MEVFVKFGSSGVSGKNLTAKARRAQSTLKTSRTSSLRGSNPVKNGRALNSCQSTGRNTKGKYATQMVSEKMVRSDQAEENKKRKKQIQTE
jgi:hypothetical protein